MAEETREGLLKELSDWIETPMLILSGVWLVLLVIELAGAGSPLVETMSVIIWIVFIAEFALKLVLAPDKPRFLARNVITMAALVVPALRLFRAVRVLRLARALRGVRLVRVVGGANRAMNALRRSMNRRGLGYVLSLTVVIGVLGALGMRTFEMEGPNAAAFSSFGDALWWTAMILTTMGSQAWPATAEGRVLAFLLSVYAFAVFGYVAASFASFFVDQDRAEKEADADLHSEIAGLRAEIAALRAEILDKPPRG
ncbi:MAG TPA: ion transporter [Caulobacteraceae bacterium]|nr:ion transporter [Caulobacteraceae bacterium]